MSVRQSVAAKTYPCLVSSAPGAGPGNVKVSLVDGWMGGGWLRDGGTVEKTSRLRDTKDPRPHSIDGPGMQCVCL